MPQETLSLKPHAIQLKYIGVRELHIRAHKPPSPDREQGEGEPLVYVARPVFDEKTSIARVGIKVEMGTEESGRTFPFELRVELIADFHVDVTNFDIEHLEDWTANNAMFILYPYLREHVYGLTARMGWKPTILKLIEVPTMADPRRGRDGIPDGEGE